MGVLRARGRSCAILLVLITISGGLPGARPARGVQSPATLQSAGSTTTAESGRAAVEESLPDVAYDDLWLLLRIARRHLTQSVTRTPAEAPPYCPPSLRGRRATLHLTLRSNGRMVAEAEASGESAVSAAADAGAALGKRLLRNQRFMQRVTEPVRDLAELGLELEWIGAPEFMTAKFAEAQRWDPALLAGFEPGVEGIGVRFGEQEGRTRPSQVIASNLAPDLALAAAEVAAGLRVEEKKSTPETIRYFRFRTHHTWEARSGARPVVLVRGMTPVAPDDVTPSGLDAAIERMGSYLVYRQNRNGFFSEEYLPSSDEHVAINHARAQVTALQGLARYSQTRRRHEIDERVFRGIDAALPNLTPLQRLDPATSGPAAASAGRVLSFKGHGQELALSAQLLDALLCVHGERRYDDARLGLTAALLACQEPDGAFLMRFSRTTDDGAIDDSASGAALAALCRSNRWKKNEAVATAFGRAMHLAALRTARPAPTSAPAATRPTNPQAALSSAPAVPPIGQAPAGGDGVTRWADAAGSAAWAAGLAEGIGIGDENRIRELVFSVVDRLVMIQVGPGCPWPDLVGALDVDGTGDVGSGTAQYLPALAAGLDLARRTGDEVREGRYRASLMLACRFILQLEFRESEGFYVQSQRDVLGGVRSAPWDNRIRVDRCAEALMGLIAGREALFGRSG